jgi:hypothetical protein
VLPNPPLVLTVPARVSALILGVLLGLFVLRVVGQIVVATRAPQWLPPMARWYSGLLPYRYLLPTQIAFVAFMTMVVSSVSGQFVPLGVGSPVAGAWLIWGSYVYALGMVVRAIRYVLARPERRGVLIPIVFHFVLAAFVFVWGCALRQG